MRIFDSAIVDTLPHYATPLIETHCHLDYLANEDLERAVALAAQVGIERLITIAVTPDNLATVVAIAEQFESVWATQGVHPHDAKLYNGDVDRQIRLSAAHPKVVAIGEIGLDYHYEDSDREAQIAAFTAQLQIAIESDLPVVIHSRDADQDMSDILEEFAPRMPRKGVIHSFTSGQALAETALELGFYLGFNGIITFKNAANVRDILALTPTERLLLETDSPYLTPVPFRGKPNAPHLLGLVAKTMAEIKEIGEEYLLQIINSNSQTLFWQRHS